MELTNKLGEKATIFQQTYLKALLENKNNLNQWKAYKEKYEDVIKNLQFYNEKSKHSVCIPLGKKAFVKGSLVHTNDVWVTLGCGWFLKTSSKRAIEICERRIMHANELIDKWEKENKLLNSMRDFSARKDVFESDDSKEIVEPFDENQEKNWKKEHKEKERKYRLQLKELREKTGSATLNDEKDIWEHLEALELQEELEDELNRIGESDTNSEDNDEDDDESDSDDISLNEDDSPRNAVVQESKLQSDLPSSKTIPIQSSQPKIIEISSTDFKTEHSESDMISASKPIIRTSKTTEEIPKKPEKRVTFENTETEFKEHRTCSEYVQDAVLDVVKENLVDTSNVGIESEKKRPMSKFKMNRNLPR